MRRDIPYDAARLLRMCRTWSFHSDADDLPEEDTGEPRLNLAVRRIITALRARAEAQGVDYSGTWWDDAELPFRISDVAIILDEYARLCRLERRVQDALGPPARMMVWRRGKFEEE
jgi:hypothetical protein